MTDDFPRLRSRIADLGRGMVKRNQQRQRRQRTYALVGGTVIVVCFTFLFSLTSLAAKLDADALTQIARLEVQNQLPEGRARVKGYLEAEAPRLVEQILRSFMEMIPQLRERVVAGITTELEVINKDFEDKLFEQFQKSLSASKSDIDRAFPDATEEEKLRKLFQVVAKDFSRGINAAVNEVYPQYAAEMNRLESYLEDLNSRELGELTDKQRTHREIIQTMLRLMIREKEGNAKL